MKRKKIIFWSIFVFCAICSGAVMVSALLEKNFYGATISWFFISISFLSVKYLLPKVEKKEEEIKKRTKIFLWSVFAFNSICLGAIMIDAMLNKNFYAATVFWVMISIGYVFVKLILNKADKKENDSVSADL